MPSFSVLRILIFVIDISQGVSFFYLDAAPLHSLAPSNGSMSFPRSHRHSRLFVFARVADIFVQSISVKSNECKRWPHNNPPAAIHLYQLMPSIPIRNRLVDSHSYSSARILKDILPRLSGSIRTWAQLSFKNIVFADDFLELAISFLPEGKAFT